MIVIIQVSILRSFSTSIKGSCSVPFLICSCASQEPPWLRGNSLPPCRNRPCRIWQLKVKKNRFEWVSMTKCRWRSFGVHPIEFSRAKVRPEVLAAPEKEVLRHSLSTLTLLSQQSNFVSTRIPHITVGGTLATDSPLNKFSRHSTCL